MPKFPDPANPEEFALLKKMLLEEMMKSTRLPFESLENSNQRISPSFPSDPNYYLEPAVIAEPLAKVTYQPKAAEIQKQHTGIVGVFYKNEWILLGNTYQYKEMLKSHRCLFREGQFGKYWYYPNPNLHIAPSQLQQLIEFEFNTTNEQEVQAVIERVETTTEGLPHSILAKRLKRREKAHKPYPLYKRQELGTFLDFVPPSWFDEFLFYLSYPVEYPVIVIVGPSGNGKTESSIQGLTSLTREHTVLDMNEFVEPYDLAGGTTFHPSEGEIWSDGVVTACFRKGLDIIINEFDAANPRAVMCLQSAFQTAGKNGKGRYISTPKNKESDRIYPQGACQIVLTMNTFGSGANMQFVGRNALDLATLDRVAFISTSYENEAKILVASGYDKKLATSLEKWAITTRKEIDRHMLRVTLSLRLLKRMAHMITSKQISLEDAAEKAFYSRIETSDVKLLKTGKY